MTFRNTTIVVLVAALAAFLAGRHFGVQANAHAAEDARVEIRSDRHSPTASIPRLVAPRPRIDPTLRAQLFEEYRCPQAACDLSPFIAENEYEAMWLRARGYPSQKNREEAKSLPTSELKHQASTGDLIAASLYGERLIEEKEWGKAYGVLVEAASRGNLYAMYALSDIAAKNPDQPNGIESKAWLRLAYLSGDYKATMQLAKTFPQLNGMPEQLLIDKFAADDFRKLMRYRSYPRPPAGN
ncbi:MAG: hypothetical protein ACOY82_14230 [Pseudomonadota bacterium]